MCTSTELTTVRVKVVVGNGNRIKSKEHNTWDSNVVPHRSTNQARTCLTALSNREGCHVGMVVSNTAGVLMVYKLYITKLILVRSS
jgi:hypothetical protein